MASPSVLMASRRADLKELSRTQLNQWVIDLGEPAWRAQQIERWLYALPRADSFEAMTNLPVSLRCRLRDIATMDHLPATTTRTARDQTVKSLMSLPSGRAVEAVLIPDLEPDGQARRLTVCVSSQVGCAMGCTFCATGRMGFQENLTCGQIVDQVNHMRIVAQQQFGRDITNVVYMGMGEPMLNYSQVSASIDLLTHIHAVGLAPRRITVSTVGLARRIRDLARDWPRVRLAVSIHAPDDAKRARIMPVSRAEPTGLGPLMDALRYHTRATGRPATFEYCMFREFNDSIEDARNLARLAHQAPAKVNLIMYNAVPGLPFERTPEPQLDAFIAELIRTGVTVTVRRSRGADIAAACGQLANEVTT